MKASSMPAATSSRLDRTIDLPVELESQVNAISTTAIAYCHEALDRSRFFTLLKNGEKALPVIQYAFLQYRFWRDRLHQWFGLCIIKASSCSDPDQKAALMSLADHIFTDLRDNHTELYLEFLYALQLSLEEIQTSHRSPATVAYERFFFHAHGYGPDNFYEALVALSGRELCVSVRNHRILQDFFDAQELKHPPWLALHAELEMDHFQDALRPALAHYAYALPKANTLLETIQRSINRHVQYFDEMLCEYEALNSAFGTWRCAKHRREASPQTSASNSVSTI